MKGASERAVADFSKRFGITEAQIRRGENMKRGTKKMNFRGPESHPYGTTTFS